jgi:hypothetical protein
MGWTWKMQEKSDFITTNTETLSILDLLHPPVCLFEFKFE